MLHLCEDVAVLGNLRSSWCFGTERRVGGVKQKRSNGVDNAFFKNKKVHDHSMLVPPTVYGINEYDVCMTDVMLNISTSALAIAEVAGMKYNIMSLM